MTDLARLLDEVDRDRLAHRFGSEAESWCDRLPILVEAIADELRLRIDSLLTAGANSVVLSCASRAGRQLVLKLTPDPAIAAQEATALSAWAAGHWPRSRRCSPSCASRGRRSTCRCWPSGSTWFSSWLVNG